MAAFLILFALYYQKHNKRVFCKIIFPGILFSPALISTFSEVYKDAGEDGEENRKDDKYFGMCDLRGKNEECGHIVRSKKG